MIQYIQGTLAAVGENAVVVDNHGIGYHISVPASVLEHMPALGREVKIYTYLHVREDILQLFGFLSMDDLEVFRQLITVNGIGPKGGLGILSVMTADDLRFAVLADDAKSISKAPGIGAKTAGKLILELKDKLKIKDVVEHALERGVADNQSEGKDEKHGKMVSEAVEALVALGYPASEAMKAVRQVDISDGISTEELLKRSLKNL
ncbi:MAG: Holliday junction branch migration protein RuvA [Lachnospiraceae bacterium]|nr:Holliday junction branch migration protein RuvA [Lachnospiraceae bacterium]